MSVDGPPGFQLLRLGFLRIAIQSSEALGRAAISSGAA